MVIKTLDLEPDPVQQLEKCRIRIRIRIKSMLIRNPANKRFCYFRLCARQSEQLARGKAGSHCH
jgi:hypothetical protein